MLICLAKMIIYFISYIYVMDNADMLSQNDYLFSVH